MEGRFTGESIAARCGSRTADELDDIRREWGLGMETTNKLKKCKKHSIKDKALEILANTA